jgi:hypothetical protein
MKLEGYDAYRFYVAVKMHFESPTYDIIKYNYKTSTNHKAFWKRKDKYFFSKTASRFNTAPELVTYFVSFFISDIKWIGDMIEHEKVFTEYQKRVQSLSYTFSSDINKLSEKVSAFDDMFRATDSPYPILIDQYLQGEICIETVVILDQLTGFIAKVGVTDNIIWPDMSRRIQKYSTFVKCDLDKMRSIILKSFTQ